MSNAKYTISALPLAQKSQLLIHKLTPDHHTPNVSAFKSSILGGTPSLQRRPRLLQPPSHYSHVSPFPVAFPYDIEIPVPTTDKANFIEDWLKDREATHPETPPTHHPNSLLRKFRARNRDQRLDLIGVSETALKDCVPHLDVGDAFAILGAPALSDELGEEGNPQPSEDQNAIDARHDLIDILSGNSTLMSPDDASVEFAPWSLRYSGHQFGSWAGQLGDGRAISILVTPHPADANVTYELQLKGSGRTPFSRTADGLAVLRSSIREYLCSEAMYALGIPTTRALSIISLPDLPVHRERTETGCVVTRVAPSFIRIGCFEAFNGPTNMFFFGGGQQPADYEGLRLLGEWTAESILKLPVAPGKAWGAELVLEVARRNALMVAGWQAYGFMHGVINTDNVSILGLTIDYGPYAFMDVFDALHICNHSDESGRYAYKFQPNMIIYALRALLNALAPLIGAEAELGGEAVREGWAKDASKEKIDEWTKKGLELREEVERVIQQVSSDEYGRLMRKRLGLKRQDPTDESRLSRPLLDLMETHRLDFHSTFRRLSSFKPSLFDQTVSDADGKKKQTRPPAVEKFITGLLDNTTPYAETLDRTAATQAWAEWLETYAARITSERDEWKVTEGTDLDDERARAMRSSNPRFVLRQWVLEEVIALTEKDSAKGKRVLAKVLHMASNPFEPWGAEDDEGEPLSKEEEEERRYCEFGQKKCSVSNAVARVRR